MASPLLNIGGLSSGLDTNSIVEQMLAIERQPRTRLDSQKSLVQARQTLLQGFQSKLRALETAARDLRSTTLFAQTQTVESGDPSRVLASAVAGSAAGVGGYQVEVSQLANSAQRTFGFVSPASAGTITIDGHDTAIAAGATVQELAAAINADEDATVYAAATDAGTLVLSARDTGDTGTGFIAVVDGSGALTEQAAKAKQGRDALFTVDGVAGTASTNVLTGAIAGVSLTLKGVTTTSGPLTVSVGAPGASAEAISGKVQAFVDSYNATVDAIRAKLTEKAVPNATTAADKQKGLLFGDTQLTGLLSGLRQAVYEPLADLPAGMDSLADLGISTGSASATVNQDALAGKLTFDKSKLAAAVASDPDGVERLLAGADGIGGWARAFEDRVHTAATTGGTLDSRIEGASAEIKSLQTSMGRMDTRLALREQSLRAQFTALETALSRSQAQGQWLSGQLAGLSA